MTVEIPLTKGYVTIVDDEDSDMCLLKWSACENKNTGVTYAHRMRHISKGVRKTEGLHRAILSKILGRELLSSEQVDHKDLDGLNNRRENLRLASSVSNAQNRRRSKRNTSTAKGVSWIKKRKKWKASIRVNGKGVFLGEFRTLEDAHQAYCDAAKKYFGEFARVE